MKTNAFINTAALYCLIQILYWLPTDKGVGKEKRKGILKHKEVPIFSQKTKSRRTDDTYDLTAYKEYMLKTQIAGMLTLNHHCYSGT